MNELLQTFIEDPLTEENKPTALPAANSTSAFQISNEYMHVIVAIYAIVFVLVLSIIVMIIVQSIRKSWIRKDSAGYDAIPRHDRRSSIPPADDLEPDVEILDDHIYFYGPHQDNDSEYENVSLDLERVDPELEEDNGIDTPPVYENPPSYLSINR